MTTQRTTENLFLAMNFVDFLDARPELPLSAALGQFAGQAGLTVSELKAVVRAFA